MEVVQNSCDKGLRLGIGGHAMIPVYSFRPCVVGCQGFNQVIVITRQQFSQIARACSHAKQHSR